MQLAMVGSGYVGLVSGACLADFGHHVRCIDVDAAKVARLRAGEVPIFEPGLDVLVARNVRAGRLGFTTDMEAGMVGADAVFIGVGTPTVEAGAAHPAGRRGEGHADLQYVFRATDAIGEALRAEPEGYTVVVTKSTVPVGTGDAIVERLVDAGVPRERFDVVSNPEFLREGAAIEDFKRPDRVVVGIEPDADPRAREVMEAVYAPLNLNRVALLVVDRRTSELIKYAGNAFLATKITFINEMADLCEAVGANVQDVARGIGLDNRIGPKFLHAGPGYGGSCFPKDTRALVQTARDHQTELSIVEAVVGANEARKRRMADKVVRAAGDVAGLRIAVLGLSFKPNTDDMRDSPALTILPRLQEAGAEIAAFDPEAMAEAAPLLPGVEMADSAEAALAGADVAVLVTEWDEFRALSLGRMASLMRGDLLVDLRNVFSHARAREAGLRYEGVGVPAPRAD